MSEKITLSKTFVAIIRLIVTLILLINSCLTAKGINPIPFDENLFTEIATHVAALLSCLWVWWKNNNVSKIAQEAQTFLDGLKNHKEDIEKITELLNDLTDGDGSHAEKED